MKYRRSCAALIPVIEEARAALCDRTLTWQIESGLDNIRQAVDKLLLDYQDAVAKVMLEDRQAEEAG